MNSKLDRDLNFKSYHPIQLLDLNSGLQSPQPEIIPLDQAARASTKSSRLPSRKVLPETKVSTLEIKIPPESLQSPFVIMSV
jgi:hypothetical protein